MHTRLMPRSLLKPVLRGLFAAVVLTTACAPAPSATPAKPAATTAPAAPAATSAPAAAAKPAESKPAEAKPAADAKPVAATTAPAAKKAGGTLRVPIQTDPFPVNPITSNELSSLLVRQSVFSQLTRVGSGTGTPEPDLATKWEASADGLTWTFTLRDNVVWHDGKPFSSADVKFTFDQIADQKNNSVERSNFADVTSVEAPTPNTVVFKLKSPLASLPVIAAVGIVPKHILEGQDIPKAADFNTKMPIGTGPYKVKNIVPGSQVELVAHEQYFRGRPNFDTVIFKIVPDVNTRVAQLKAGELDYVGIEPVNLSAVQNEKNLKVDTIVSPEINLLNINHQNPLFTDKRVNQALEYALDRKGILENVAMGKGTLAPGPLPSALKYWYDTSITARPYDVEKAKSLLAEAGWTPGPDGVLQKDGKKFSFTIMLDKGSAVRDQLAVLAQQYWKRVGMEVAIESVERSVYGDRLRSHEFEATVTNRPSSWDPDNQRRFYLCSAGSNFGLYCNQQADELLKKGVAEMDPAKRKEIYNQYQKVVFDDPVFVPLYYPDEIRVMVTKLEGLPELPSRDQFQHINEWYFSQ